MISAILTILALMAAPGQADSRQPVPAPAAQKESEKLIREIFKDEYSKKGLPDRQAFVKKLLAQARQTKDDPSAHYVLLRDARTMATEIGDADTALAATDELVQAYAVEGLALRHTTLAALGQAAKSPADPRPIATALLKLADEAVDAENLEIAEKAAKDALQLASRAREMPLVTRANAVLKRIGELKPLRDKIKKATEDLDANPDDATANHALGHYKCFVRGKWDEGLPLLTKGKDEALKALAVMDLAAPADTAGQTAVGDAWWTWSEKESGPGRAGARRRAAHWYDKALGTAVGLTKIRLEKRMGELGIPTEAELLPLIDLSRDKVHGDWAFDGRILTCMRPQFPSRVQLPYEPPAEYDLTLVVERIEGQAGVMIGCVRESAQFYVAIDDHAGSWSGISNVDGKASNSNETSVPGPLLTNNKTATIVCMVRRDEIGVTVDGKRVISFKGGNERLSNNQAFTVPNRRGLFVGTGNARYVFSKILLKPVSGRGVVRTEPSTFDPVGTWVKQGTGTEFVFKAAGVLEGPKSTDPQYQAGRWERIKETIVLSFPNGERIELRIMDGAALGGAWTLKRK